MELNIQDNCWQNVVNEIGDDIITCEIDRELLLNMVDIVVKHGDTVPVIDPDVLCFVHYIKP